MIRALVAGFGRISLSRIYPLHGYDYACVRLDGIDCGAKQDSNAIPMQPLNHRTDNPA
jgi:hypothetical protein